MRKMVFVSIIALLLLSLAAQAEISEKRAPFTVYLDTEGTAVGRFDGATSAFYAATSEDGDGVRDRMNFILGGDFLDISSDAQLKATYTYNAPAGSIAGQADAYMYLAQYLYSGRVGEGAVTRGDPVLVGGEGDLGNIKRAKLNMSASDQTITIFSRDVLPAGRYNAVFEVHVPGYVGWPGGRLVRADAISGVRMISVRLETVPSGGAAKSSSGGSAPQIRTPLPSAKPIPRL